MSHFIHIFNNMHTIFIKLRQIKVIQRNTSFQTWARNVFLTISNHPHYNIPNKILLFNEYGWWWKRYINGIFDVEHLISFEWIVGFNVKCVSINKGKFVRDIRWIALVTLWTNYHAYVIRNVILIFLFLLWNLHIFSHRISRLKAKKCFKKKVKQQQLCAMSNDDKFKSGECRNKSE